jgi:aryl-alcohol dehydrogenase-like predicted oxidoreductase
MHGMKGLPNMPGRIPQTVALGASSLRVSPLGVGTWQWGDRAIWRFGTDYTRADCEAAYASSRAAGVTFFDTAEIYGRGASEELLGVQVRKDLAPPVVATKFAPLPGRLTAASVARALDASLRRLGMSVVDLYQVHWPFTLLNLDTVMLALADQVAAGRVRAVGVSNFSARQIERARTVLARRNIPLASNQVSYSLLHRDPERNGVLEACRQLDVRLIAYSPLSQGALTGKYHEGVRIRGVRALTGPFRPAALHASAPLIQRMREIGAAHGDKTPAQVALNWLMCRGALPIPGAKNAAQATANAGALGWELTDEEYARLSALSRGV